MSVLRGDTMSGNRTETTLPSGFDIEAVKAREAILVKPPKTPPRAPGRVANVFRRRGQWSLAWWEMPEENALTDQV